MRAHHVDALVDRVRVDAVPFAGRNPAVDVVGEVLIVTGNISWEQSSNSQNEVGVAGGTLCNPSTAFIG